MQNKRQQNNRVNIKAQSTKRNRGGLNGMNIAVHLEGLKAKLYPAYLIVIIDVQFVSTSFV
jgi:hypothetical protein